MTERTVIEGRWIATINADRDERPDGHLVIEGDRIRAVGQGPAPRLGGEGPIRRVSGEGCLVAPGLVSCHHYLYQSVTRGLAQQASLFEWLVQLYPIWARLDADIEDAAARAGRAALARPGRSTSSDRHYGFSRGVDDLLAVELDAARALGLRFHACRGRWDRGPGGRFRARCAATDRAADEIAGRPVVDGGELQTADEREIC